VGEEDHDGYELVRADLYGVLGGHGVLEAVDILAREESNGGVRGSCGEVGGGVGCERGVARGLSERIV
jgi:hypothetical protein